MEGITPIERRGLLDFFIDRPDGMKGWILNLTVKGLGRVGKGAGAFDIGQGDLMLLPPGVVHYYGRHPESENWWHRWIYFKPSPLWMNWLNWRLSIQGVHVLRFHDGDTYREQERLFTEIATWPLNADRLSMELSMNLLERLILLCARQDRITGDEHKSFDGRLMTACRYIIENLQQPLSVDDVAQVACLSPSRLAHLFTDQLGQSIMRWRDEQRIQRACQIIQQTNDPIKVIAAQVGYEDPLYFARVFHRHIGMSPRAFRNQSLLKED